MKYGKRVVYALLVAVVLTVTAFPSIEAKAGKSEILFDENTLEGSGWNNPEGDVLIKDKKIVFAEDNSDYARFITKTAAKKDDSFDVLVELSGEMILKQLPKEKSFILAFGLTSIESVQGDAGNIEVTFINDGGIKMSLSVYDESGNKTEIVKPTACGVRMNQATDVKGVISTDGTIHMAVNGREIFAEKLPVSGEGCVGLMQTGGCEVEIAKVRVVQYGYDRPENSNVEETFDNGTMDISLLTAKLLGSGDCYPAEQIIEEYQGNPVMMFRNAGLAYMATVYKYSNFELTFDVPYLQSEAEYNEDGSVESVETKDIVVSYGGEQASWEDVGWKLVADSIVVTDGRVYSNNHPDRDAVDLEQNPFMENNAFSLKISVVDGVVTVGMKNMEEDKFRTILNYSTDNGTPSGYIHIWTSTSANFAIDNIKITNLDENPNLIETEFKSGKFDVPEDYQAEPIERVYVEKKGAGSSWYLLIPIATVAGGLILGVSALVIYKKKREKEAARDA